MLELIVLGQIPGTSYQLNFTQIALTATLFMSVLLALHQFKYLFRRARRMAQSRIEQQAI